MINQLLIQEIYHLEWVKQAKEGDLEAIYKLWQAYEPLWESWARKTFLPYFDKDDLRQQSYLILLDALKKYDEEKGMSFGGYYKMQLMIWRSRQLRKKQELSSNVESIQRAMEEVASPKEALENQIEDHLLAEQIMEQLGTLSKGEEKVLKAHLIEGKPISSLCETFGMSLEGLKTRRKRGLRKLREKVSQELGL